MCDENIIPVIEVNFSDWPKTTPAVVVFDGVRFVSAAGGILRRRASRKAIDSN